MPVFDLNAQSMISDINQIKLEMSIQEQAWNRGDIKSYMGSYWQNDSLLFIGSKGVTYGWTSTLTNYLKSYPDQPSMGKLTFENISIRILDSENAYVIGKWYLKREMGDLNGHYTLLWKRINGRWKIVADHSS